MLRDPRQHNQAHLDFVRSLPCMVCGNDIETQAAHVRMMDPSIGKPMSGLQMKPHDKYTLPMCGICHMAQHAQDEEAFWQSRGVDPVKVALALYSVTGDHAAGCRIVYASRSQ